VDEDLSQPGATTAPEPVGAGPAGAASDGAGGTPPAVDVRADARVDDLTAGTLAHHLPDGQGGNGATASQLRRFIKSRPWVPMHELRRRFGIEGTDDEMAPIDLKDGRIFAGLPPREAALLGDLIRQGEIGYELVHDPDCPGIAGVYPMRPVVRT
jgi:hypothetical protein